MAIYKLGEIVISKKGEIEKKEYFSKKYINNFYPIFSAGISIKGFYKFKNREKNIICISSSGVNAGFISIPQSDFFAADCFTLESKNKDKVLQSYLNYKILTIKDLIQKSREGSAQPHVYFKNIEKFEIKIPSISEQQRIIDIIEPLEQLKNNLINQLNLFIKMSNFLVEEYDILDYMKNSCFFIKGLMANNYSLGKTLFLNVSAANGNPNKYCDNEPNIFPRDVTLSLDGNTGLVNNNLLGFNGYLYKIESKNISNWQIYYSLKHRINQKIIKLNETGTTIKHSSNSKLELMLLKFKYKEILKIFFDIEINLKNQIELVTKQINNLISLLIK